MKPSSEKTTSLQRKKSLRSKDEIPPEINWLTKSNSISFEDKTPKKDFDEMLKVIVKQHAKKVP